MSKASGKKSKPVKKVMAKKKAATKRVAGKAKASKGKAVPSGVDVKEIIFGDLERELGVTRKVLERLPEEHYAWKPHDKSMSVEQLALHVADLPEWVRVTLAQDVLDFASAPQSPKKLENRAQLLERFDQNVKKLHEAVKKFDMNRWDREWSIRNGEKVIVSKERPFVYRVWSWNHLIHHRGQLCLYLRLLNVPVPTVYFNTADEPEMVFE